MFTFGKVARKKWALGICIHMRNYDAFHQDKLLYARDIFGNIKCYSTPTERRVSACRFI